MSEHDEGQGSIANYLHADLLLSERGDPEHARAVRLKIHRLVGQLPIGTDGKQIGVQQPVEPINMAGEHRGLQTPAPAPTPTAPAIRRSRRRA